MRSHSASGSSLQPGAIYRPLIGGQALTRNPDLATKFKDGDEILEGEQPSLKEKQGTKKVLIEKVKQDALHKDAASPEPASAVAEPAPATGAAPSTPYPPGFVLRRLLVFVGMAVGYVLRCIF